MMDKEQFLASGLLEQYALGLTSPEENRLVEHFVENYPDIRTKLETLQSAVEQYASQYAVPPPRQLKSKILSEIQEEEEFGRNFSRRSASPRKVYVSFAGIVLVALVSIGVLLWRQHQLQVNNEVLSGELDNYRSQYRLLQEEQTLAEKIFDFIENGDAYVVHLNGVGLAADAHAVVYWNPKSRKSYVKLVKMPALSSGQQFQIWADVDGNMIDAGLIDNARKDLQPVDYIENADSLNITVEPLGGSKKPSVRLLIAKGKI